MKVEKRFQLLFIFRLLISEEENIAYFKIPEGSERNATNRQTQCNDFLFAPFLPYLMFRSGPIGDLRVS